jgi:von Willebrand factor type A domain
VLAMLVESYGRPEFLPRLREMARYLVEAQGGDGSWDYTRAVPTELLRDPDQRVLQVTGGTPLDGSPKTLLDCPRTLPVDKWGSGDNSVTQFALLGLAAAARMDLRIPTATWQRARALLVQRQLRDHGFGYAGSPSEAATGSMTCAGVCGLAITAHELGLDPTAPTKEITAGIDWIDQHFAVDKNPGSGAWNLYYLYGLERTGRMLETEFLGAHEFYPLGVQHLVATQLADGSWPDTNTPPQDTAFAILFLTRATHRLAEPLHRGGSGTLATACEVGPARRLYIVLDASGSMLDQLGGVTKFKVARDAVRTLIQSLRDGDEVALRVYGHRKRAIEPEAATDTALEIPIGPLDQHAFLVKLDSLRARGLTPLTLSLEQAFADLEHTSGDKQTTVLLLTDGGEDTHPKREPAAAAADLARLPGVELEVIGFDIHREDWSRQLEAIAARGNGHYWPVAHPEDLERHLQTAVLRAPESFRVVDAKGGEAGHGRFGDRLSLPEGRYRFETEYAGKPFSTELWVNTDAVTSVVFDGSHATVR